MAPEKRLHDTVSKQPAKIKKRKSKPILEGSEDDVLIQDIISLLRKHGYPEVESNTLSSNVDGPLFFSRFEETEVDIMERSASGEINIRSLWSVS